MLPKALNLYSLERPSVDWIRLAQDRVQWLDLLNTIMSLLAP
jgi:hypothetical protein